VEVNSTHARFLVKTDVRRHPGMTDRHDYGNLRSGKSFDHRLWNPVPHIDPAQMRNRRNRSRKLPDGLDIRLHQKSRVSRNLPPPKVYHEIAFSNATPIAASRNPDLNAAELLSITCGSRRTINSKAGAVLVLGCSYRPTSH